MLFTEAEAIESGRPREAGQILTSEIRHCLILQHSISMTALKQDQNITCRGGFKMTFYKNSLGDNKLRAKKPHSVCREDQRFPHIQCIEVGCCHGSTKFSYIFRPPAVAAAG